MSLRKKPDIYLGDSVYAHYADGMIFLWTSNGIEDSDSIALEPEVYIKLVDYAAQHWNMAKNGKVKL